MGSLIEDKPEEGGVEAVAATPDKEPSELPVTITPDMKFNFQIRNVAVGCSARTVLPVNEPLQTLLTFVCEQFQQEPSRAYELIYQKPIKSGGLEEQSLSSSDPNRPLLDFGFDCSPYNRNNLHLTETTAAPRPHKEDDMVLGASASTTYHDDAVASFTFVKRKSVDKGPTKAIGYGSYGASTSRTDTGYVGLVNQAMTCYLNSLLQTLYMTPEFRNALYRWEFKGSEEEASKNIPCQLQRLFLQLQTAERSAVETTNLTKSFGWDSSEAWQQHDIQELCRVMFDALEQCFKNTDQSDLISNLYEGKMKDYVKCLVCGRENAREDTFLDVPLPIRPFGSSSAYNSLEEALKAFVEPEVLTENNQYECSECASLCDAHKGLKFTRFPYMLTCHLKRFDFDYNTFHRIKLNDKVTFPTHLDLNCLIGEPLKEATTDCPKMEQSPVTPEKLDDTSTTDSGSILDAEENSSVEVASSSPSQNELDTQDEDEGIDVSNSFNDKNKMATNGPHVYELFSIMIHSGSASGGHYYVYIKDFTNDEWFSFNDQSVTKITMDDIRRTYGGGGGNTYYSSWSSSSANAYMLMYRQVDQQRNAKFFTPQTFPQHIKELLARLAKEEAVAREAKEKERHTCRIKLFAKPPKQNELVESTFKVHGDVTLAEATKLAYQKLELEGVIPLDQCRLVKYDCMLDSIESSFSEPDDTMMKDCLDGVKSVYKFALLLETREQNEKFNEYTAGGTTIKVQVVNLKSAEIGAPLFLRLNYNMTVREFKELLGQTLNADPHKMSLVHNYLLEWKAIINDEKTLKQESIGRASLLLVEPTGSDGFGYRQGSLLANIIETYENTINIYCNLPEVTDKILEDLQIPRYTPAEPPAPETVKAEPLAPVRTQTATSSTETPASSSSLTSVTTSMTSPTTTSISNAQETEVTEKPSNSTGPMTSALNAMLSTPCIAGATQSPWNAANLTDNEVDLDPCVSTVNSDQSASEDSSLTSDSDRTLVGDPTDEELLRWSLPLDLSNNSSNEECEKEEMFFLWDLGAGAAALQDEPSDTDNPSQDPPVQKDPENKRYFEVTRHDHSNKTLEILLDKRILIGQLKEELVPFVGVATKHFKLFRLFTSSCEYECARLLESMKACKDNLVMTVRLSRALLPDEFKGKVFTIDFENHEEPANFLQDFIITKGDSVLAVKQALVEEINVRTDMKLHVDRVRLRKKCWKNPQTIYLDSDVFDKDILLHPNWEMFLQLLDKPEIKKNEDDLCLFAKRWRPSSYTTDPLEEFILPEGNVETMHEQLSKLSGIAVEDVMFCKGTGTFPCDMSVMKIEQELYWGGTREASLDHKSVYIINDGHVIYYKDKTELLKQLTEPERRELNEQENTRFNIDTHVMQVNTSRFKEKTLTIHIAQPQQSTQ